MTQRVAELRCMLERAKEEDTSPLALAFRLEALALPLLDRLDSFLGADRCISMQLQDIRELLISLRESIHELSL